MPSATTAGSPPTSYGDAATPPDSQSAPTAPQSNTATSTQSATATGGAGGSATGGNAGPSQAGGDSSQGGDAYANGGRAETHSSLENRQSDQISVRDGSGARLSGKGRFESDGQDTFVVERAKGRGADGAAAKRNHARSRRHVESGTAGRVTQRETKARADHETGKASPLDRGLPGHGGQSPSQNPFFSLLSGSGGAGTGLLLLLAVLGASIALPNHRLKAFRTPAVPWRPSAYVPPIELPG